MQDFDVNTDEETDALDAKTARLERLRELSRILLKKLVTFVAFGPGVLVILWLIGRIFRR